MPASEETPPLAIVLEELVVLVRRLPARPALSPTTASALRTLVVEGPQRISALVDRLGVSQPAMTQLVDRLVTDGMAQRGCDARDRRAVLVTATEAGRQALAERRATRGRALDALLDGLSTDDRRRLVAAAPVLHRLAQLPLRAPTPAS